MNPNYGGHAGSPLNHAEHDDDDVGALYSILPIRYPFYSVFLQALLFLPFLHFISMFSTRISSTLSILGRLGTSFHPSF